VPARVNQIRDLVVSVLKASAADRPVASTTIEVEAVTVIRVDPDAMTANTMSVQVRADGWTDGGPMTRGIDLTDYRIQVAAVEAYTVAGDVPAAWLDARVDWFQTAVIDALADARDQLDGAYAFNLEDVAIDPDELDDKWLVWLQAEIVFRDERAVT
jgi:hypothetical protein